MANNRQIGSGESRNVWLQGKMTHYGLKLECGYEIPKTQIEWLVRMFGLAEPYDGDSVSLKIDNLGIRRHVHCFKCECGETHREGFKG